MGNALNENLLIKARVVNFVENAMRHHFRTGPCHFYDATLLEILEAQRPCWNKVGHLSRQKQEH